MPSACTGPPHVGLGGVVLILDAAHIVGCPGRRRHLSVTSQRQTTAQRPISQRQQPEASQRWSRIHPRAHIQRAQEHRN